MNFPIRPLQIGIISIILIVSLSYGLYFFLQGLTEDSIKTNLFEQQRLRQLDTNNAISQHIASDMDSILTRLKVVANSAFVQQNNLTGNLTESKIEQLLQEMYNENKQLVGKADIFFIVDRSGLIRLIVSDREYQQSLIGSNISFREYANLTASTQRPVFSTGLESSDSTYRIFITYPIINRETGQYQGFVGAGIPTINFFEGFGNVYDINSQYLVALDRNATQLVHSNPQLIGKNFFGEYTQNFTKHNRDLNNLMKKVLSGESGDVVYTIGLGERLTTGSPTNISAEGNMRGIPPYVTFIVTPTSQIYSKFEDILFTQRIETFALLATSTAAAIILIAFLIKWSKNLDTEIKRRTTELESAYEQLKGHEKMQQDFINIAAHELRTPTQSIVGYSELLEHDYNLKEGIDDGDRSTRDSLEAIRRNAIRLRNLTNDILDVSRIDAGKLKLNKERINLNEKVRNVVKDISVSNLQIAEKKLTIEFLNDEKIDNDNENEYYVNADKSRIFQVLSNLINNAIKFAGINGPISISLYKVYAPGLDNNTVEKKEYVCIRIKDNGIGIDTDIQPRLFSKFATKSDTGTGLGLFIAKSIVEAHGGMIWAVNNANEKGATFSFTLPLST